MDRVWYVAYGTNLSSARFRCYLVGGRPEGGSRIYPGCRDRTEPGGDVSVDFPGSLAFIGRSSVWGGGTAVFHPQGSGRVAGRAYLVTAEQCTDLLAQESRQLPGADLDLDPLWRSDRLVLGPGRYQTVVRMGTRGGLPMVTFTCDREDDLAAPARAYLRVMAAGLRESRAWSSARIALYLARIAGAERVGTPDAIAAIVA
ncbi:histone deacetylase [Diaminobutyricibacter tongyongensis]|uniref:Histone deacetylase n=1 Tax=Leifsonia tongyongensis TaxID=1268043 RepID=A0A6L9XSM4_9MICO|nr:histone deacetylase [Diaminobutyricibacter tongyongensis]NEN04297.1 histone deacetylase [Diaminobutyricibacter tongyongensis]